MSIRVAIDTLGCKLNQAESESIVRDLAQAGFTIVPSSEEADVYLLNTCTVTHVADRKCRNLLRQARRKNPAIQTVATGCYVSSSAEVMENGLADIIVPNKDKARLLEILSRLIGTGATIASQAAGVTGRRKARSFVKIQSGCRNSCAYCIVPEVRGYPYSVPAQQVLTEIQARASEGYQEVVLTGTEIGSYSSEGLGLQELVLLVLAKTNIPRIRLSSLQPAEITQSLLTLWQNPRMCRHWHIPLQSGSYTVLQRMQRAYTPHSYQQVVNMIRASVPDGAITTDLIVGFPGETDGEFLESYHFCKAIGFSRIHIFPFSVRTGTMAAKMTPQVAPDIKNKRVHLMQLLAADAQHNFLKGYSGGMLPVLWEEETDGIWTGLTDNYIRVYTKSNRDIASQVLKAQLIAPCRGGMRANVEEN